MLYVLYVRGGCELRIIEELRLKNITAYCPRQIKSERHRGKWEYIERIIFTRYIFIDLPDLTANIWHSVMKCTGAIKFVSLCSLPPDEESFGIIPERWISPNQRFKTEFSDKRMQIFTLIMRDHENKPVMYRAAPSFESQTAIISFETEQNPLILGQSERSISDVLKNILHTIHRMSMQPFASEIANDPALEAGDYIAIQEGGDNDRGNFSSMITHNIWRYHGHHEIRSGASMQVVEFDKSAAAAFSARITEEDKTYVQPISQADKASRNKSLQSSSAPDRLIYGAGTDSEGQMRLLNGSSVIFLDKNSQMLGWIKPAMDPSSPDGFGLFSDGRRIGFPYYSKDSPCEFVIQDRWFALTISPISGEISIRWGNTNPSMSIRGTQDCTEIQIGGHSIFFNSPSSEDKNVYFDNRKVVFEDMLEELISKIKLGGDQQ